MHILLLVPNTVASVLNCWGGSFLSSLLNTPQTSSSNVLRQMITNVDIMNLVT